MARKRSPGIYFWVPLLVIAVVVGIWLFRRAPAMRPAFDPDAVLSRMTVEQKVGQMVMAGFPGQVLSAEANELVGRHFLGGVMLASRNISDANQVRNLTTQLQRLARKSGAGVPLFIAADQEGGYVVRLRGSHGFPGNMALGAAADVALTRRVAEAMGWELRAAGINMDFAPVVDVNSNPANPVIGVRSFGENPAAVAAHGAAFVAGLQAAGVLSTAKHFPGHGDTAQDSHVALPSVHKSRQQLDQVELLPFRRLIAAGVDAIMTAHVTFPAIESTPGLPATLSEKVLTGLLRREMEFNGLIITDAMEMQAIAAHYDLAEAAVKAVQAGADIVLVAWPRDWREAIHVVDGLVRAVRAGEISEEQINAAVRRILTVKANMGWEPDARPLTNSDRQQIAAVSQEAAAGAVTLVRDTKQRLPLTEQAGRILVIMPAIQAVTGAEDTGQPESDLAHSLRQFLSRVDEARMPVNPDPGVRAELVARARGYDAVVVCTYSAWTGAHAGQAALVQEMMATGVDPIVLALREPYDIMRFPAVSTYLVTYSANSESLAAAAATLAGTLKPQGRLPVTLPGLYAVGHGL